MFKYWPFDFDFNQTKDWIILSRNFHLTNRSSEENYWSWRWIQLISLIRSKYEAKNMRKLIFYHSHSILRLRLKLSSNLPSFKQPPTIYSFGVGHKNEFSHLMKIWMNSFGKFLMRWRKLTFQNFANSFIQILIKWENSFFWSNAKTIKDD